MSGETIYDPANEKRPSHYHGDMVRALFITEAVLIFLTRFIGTQMPFSTGGLMMVIIILIIAAGITNPVQQWIHWLNVGIAALGLLLFGGIALARLQSAADLVTHNGLVAIIAMSFIASLYFTTATVRGMLVPHVDPDEEEERPYIVDPE